MLSDADLRRARPRARPYKMWDGRGLHLLVMPNGRRTWLVRSRSGGRERLLTIGSWPDHGVDEARRRRDRALDGSSLIEGNVLAGNTFEQAARAWHELRRASWSMTHAADVLASLERDVFPAIGAMRVDTIAPPELLNAIRSVELRGRGETARRIRQRCSAIFGFAIAEGWCGSNPAATIAQALLPPKLTQPHPALVDIDACRDLLGACNQLVASNKMVLLASRFLALTAVRLDAVRGMRWGELEDLDTAPVWRVPPARMKLSRSKKTEASFAHLVPISVPALLLLRQAAAENGYDTHSAPADGLVFPGAGGSSPLGERAIGALYVRAGFAGRHVPHGWRASFSTIMNELMPEERDAIDLALAHAGKGKVEGAYNRAQLLGRRRALFERWGELLTST